MMRTSLINKLSLTALLLLNFSFGTCALAQDLLNDAGSEITLGDSANQFSETVNIISRSGKIFILSNSNQLLNKGDFITLSLKDGGPISRSVVAKTHEGQAGIKMLKVYSLSRWNKLRRGVVVNILKGDDSALFNIKKKEEVSQGDAKIDSEEDLFNDKALLNEDLTDFYKDNRLIKPDNIVTAGYNQLRFTDDYTSDTIAGNEFNFSWGYQFSDNYWVEGLYGRTQIDSYPDDGNQTIINNITARVKYTFKAPFYSYVMPYLGFKTVSVSSPDAGIALGQTAADLDRANKEQKTIDELERTNIILGVTVLKRLVPGWFLKADMGTDIFSLGFGIEF
ncbi:MAG: hypothetical protein ACJAS4_002568 [Bacteriovoracaceae bacterium]|jgi:hypothetical protein